MGIAEATSARAAEISSGVGVGRLDGLELGRNLPVRGAGLFGGSGQRLVALDAVPELEGEVELSTPDGSGPPAGSNGGDRLAEVDRARTRSRPRAPLRARA